MVHTSLRDLHHRLPGVSLPGVGIEHAHFQHPFFVEDLARLPHDEFHILPRDQADDPGAIAEQLQCVPIVGLADEAAQPFDAAHQHLFAR